MQVESVEPVVSYFHKRGRSCLHKVVGMLFPRRKSTRNPLRYRFLPARLFRSPTLSTRERCYRAPLRAVYISRMRSFT